MYTYETLVLYKKDNNFIMAFVFFMIASLLNLKNYVLNDMERKWKIVFYLLHGTILLLFVWTFFVRYGINPQVFYIKSGFYYYINYTMGILGLLLLINTIIYGFFIVKIFSNKDISTLQDKILVIIQSVFMLIPFMLIFGILMETQIQPGSFGALLYYIRSIHNANTNSNKQVALDRLMCNYIRINRNNTIDLSSEKIVRKVWKLLGVRWPSFDAYVFSRNANKFVCPIGTQGSGKPLPKLAVRKQQTSQ